MKCEASRAQPWRDLAPLIRVNEFAGMIKAFSVCVMTAGRSKKLLPSRIPESCHPTG